MVPTNTKSTKYNGMVYGHAVHFIDQIVSLYGQPNKLISDIYNQRDWLYSGSGDIEDYYHIQMIYDHLRVGVNFNPIAVKAPPRFVIYGSEGTLEKYGIDCQERDLKQGIYLSNPNFGKDEQGMDAHIYYQDGKTEIVKSKLGYYDQFYRNLVNAITSNGQLAVSEFEGKVVINILETIVLGKEYQKI